MSNKTAMNNDQLLRKYCRENNTTQALRLLSEGADPLFNQGTALVWMAQHGNEVLLNHCERTVDPKGFDVTHVLINLCKHDNLFDAYFEKWHKDIPAQGVRLIVENLIKNDHPSFDRVWKAWDLGSSASHIEYVCGVAALNNKPHILQSLAPHWVCAKYIGVTQSLLKHNNVDLLNKLMPFVMWSDQHQEDVACLFWHESDVFDQNKNRIPQHLISTCLAILNRQVGVHEKQNKALEEVTDVPTVENALRCWVVQEDGEWLSSFFNHHSNWQEMINKITPHLNEKSRHWLEEQTALFEKKVLTQQTLGRSNAQVCLKKKM